MTGLETIELGFGLRSRDRKLRQDVIGEKR
jgi:hypothetical protein